MTRRLPAELSRDEMLAVLREIYDTLWYNPASGQYEADLKGDYETLERIAEHMDNAGLKPAQEST